MKNKKILIVMVGVIAAIIITYLIYNYQQSNKKITPVPQTQEQKEFDNSFAEVTKQKPVSLEAVYKPDKISTLHEQIEGNMLGFIGNDQIVYKVNLETKEISDYTLPEEVFEEDVKFVKFSSDFKQAVVGFRSVGKIALVNLETKDVKIIKLELPLGAAYKDDKFYILNNDDTLKISTLENGILRTTTQTRVQSDDARLDSYRDQLVITSENGTYLESGEKISESGFLILGKDQDNLVLLNELDDQIEIEIYDSNLKKEKSIHLNQAITDLYLAPDKLIYATIRLSEEANVNDKLLKIGFDGKQSEIILPSQYPDFLREFKFDKILKADKDSIYYADQGNVFKINL